MGVPVQQEAGERPVCLARSKGRQGQGDSRAVVDAAGRDRLADAAKDMVSAEGRIGQQNQILNAFGIHVLSLIRNGIGGAERPRFHARRPR